MSNHGRNEEILHPLHAVEGGAPIIHQTVSLDVQDRHQQQHVVEQRLRLENEQLKTQLAQLTNQLQQFRRHQSPPTSPSSALNKKKKRLPTWKTPFRTTTSSPSSSSNQPLPVPAGKRLAKTNLHPSDHYSLEDGMTNYHNSSSSSSSLDENNRTPPTAAEQYHESAAGLKHRRHSPRGATRPSPASNSSSRRLLLHHEPHTDETVTIPFLQSFDGDNVEKTFQTPVPSKLSASTPETVPMTQLTYQEDSTLVMEDPSPYASSRRFVARIQDRAGWLVILLFLQSLSSFIISRNEALLQNHLVIVRFLTMLVGAGGNAGNQASVGVIRGLATGTVHDRNLKQTIVHEVQVGLALSIVLGVSGALRAALFMTPLAETVAITTSLVSIVFISVLLGAILPIFMRFCKIDPAHSSTTIQVVMDILGVLITVHVSSFVLDGSLPSIAPH